MGRLTALATRAGKGKAGRSKFQSVLGRWARMKLYRGHLQNSTGFEGVTSRGPKAWKQAAENRKRRSLSLIESAMAKSINLPPLESAEKVSRPANPSLSTVVSNLAAILKVVHKIGMLSKEQQDTLIEQIKQANQASREQAQEAPVAKLVGVPANDNDISPLDAPLTELANQINVLIAAIKEAKVGGNNDNDTDTFGGRKQKNAKSESARGGKGKWNASKGLKGLGSHDISKLESKGYKVTKNGILAPAKIGKDGKALGRSFVSLNEAEKVIHGRIPTALSKFKSNTVEKAGRVVKGSSVAKGAKALAGSAPAQKIAGTLATGIKASRGKMLGKVGLDVIQKIAGPIIAKGIGKTVLKSIPIVGAVAGAGFALSRLIQGDVVGAGLELASGLAGPLTAIPAFIASVARDTYSGAYGVQPEQDPYVAERMGQITDSVKSLVMSALKPSIKKTDSASQANPYSQVTGGSPTSPEALKAPTVPSLAGPVTAGAGADVGAAPTAQPAAAPTAQPAAAPAVQTSGTVEQRAKPAGPSLAATGGPAKIATPSPANDKGFTPPPESFSSGSVDTSPMPLPPKVASVTPPAPTVGRDIIEKTTTNDAKRNDAPPVDLAGLSRPNKLPRTPATSPTSRTGAKGMGNVPNVNYSYSEFAGQLYFGAMAA